MQVEGSRAMSAQVLSAFKQAQIGAQENFAQSLEGSLQQLRVQAPSTQAQQTVGTARQGFGYIAPMVVKSSSDEDFKKEDFEALNEWGKQKQDEFSQIFPQSGGLASIMQGIADAGRSGTLSGSMSAFAGAAQTPQVLSESSVERVQILATSVTDRAKQNRAVMDSFRVESNRKYAVNQKGTGDTYCNIYVADVSKALGSPVPRIVDRTTGAPATNKDPNITYLNANRMNDWLNGSGKNYGWVEVTPDQAQHYANLGYVAVTSWKNPDGSSGHVQMVSPSKDGTYNEAKGVAIAQAGSKLMNYGYAEDVYKTSTLKKIQYFVNMAPQSAANQQTI